MLRTVVLLAGLGAALTIAGLSAVRGEAAPDTNQTAWAEQHVQNITPGHSYRLDGCFTVTASGLKFVSLRIKWHPDPGGYGSLDFSVSVTDAFGDPSRVGTKQCLSLTAEAPCTALSARYGVVALEDSSAVAVSSLAFSLEPGATPVPCPTPAPTSTPTPTLPFQPTPTATPSPVATISPVSPPEPTPTPQAVEPRVFPSLVNGGFEEVRQDGTPYGWRKVGGEMSASSAVRAEGERSAALVSRTESTKWLYQTVSVKGGAYYRLQAKALKNDPRVRETLLRISWYESADGSGRQMDTADSKALAGDAPRFVSLDTGPVQAPPEARSAKIRLLIRPASAARAVVYFDDVRFEEAAAPQAEDNLNGEQSAANITIETFGAGREGAVEAASVEAALGAWVGPTPLANARRTQEQQAPSAASSGRPLWPLLLAVAVPAAGLMVMVGSAWRRAHVGGGNEPHV